MREEEIKKILVFGGLYQNKFDNEVVKLISYSQGMVTLTKKRVSGTIIKFSMPYSLLLNNYKYIQYGQLEFIFNRLFGGKNK